MSLSFDEECPYFSMRNGKSFGQKTDFSFRLTPELIVVSEPICPSPSWPKAAKNSCAIGPWWRNCLASWHEVPACKLKASSSICPYFLACHADNNYHRF